MERLLITLFDAYPAARLAVISNNFIKVNLFTIIVVICFYSSETLVFISVGFITRKNTTQEL